MDLSKVDVCTLLPASEAEAVFGTKLQKPPQADPPNGNEKGCIYYNEQGHYADIVLHPVDDWSFIKQVQTEGKDLPDIDGHSAFGGEMQSAYRIYVLAQGKAVVDVRDSSGDQGQAEKFVRKVLSLLK